MVSAHILLSYWEHTALSQWQIIAPFGPGILLQKQISKSCLEQGKTHDTEKVPKSFSLNEQADHLIYSCWSNFAHWFYFNAFYSKKAHRNLPSRCSISLTLTLLKKNVLYSKHESQLSEVLAGKSKLTNQVKLKFCARQLFHLEHSDSFRNIKQPHPSSQYKKHNGFCKF